MPLGSKKSVENACSSDLESTWSVETARRSDCRGDLGRSWLGREAHRKGQVGLVGPGRRATPGSPTGNSNRDIYYIFETFVNNKY